jgi:hypothetical protein
MVSDLPAAAGSLFVNYLRRRTGGGAQWWIFRCSEPVSRSGLLARHFGLSIFSEAEPQRTASVAKRERGEQLDKLHAIVKRIRYLYLILIAEMMVN